MSLTIAQTKGWQCTNYPQCKYFQDTDPTNLWQQSADMFPDVPLGKCPSCYGRFGEFDLAPVATDSPSQMEVADDATLEATQVPDLDVNGQPILVQVGQHYELQVDPSTGAVSSVAVPDYEIKMRSLTTDELNALKAQRDNDLSTLDSIAA